MGMGEPPTLLAKKKGRTVGGDHQSKPERAGMSMGMARLAPPEQKKEKHGREGVAIHPTPYKKKKTRTGGCATNLGPNKAHRHGPRPSIR